MTRPLAAYAVAAYLFLHAPLFVLVVFSFNSSRFTLWEGFSLRWYQATLRDGHRAPGRAAPFFLPRSAIRTTPLQ